MDAQQLGLAFAGEEFGKVKTAIDFAQGLADICKGFGDLFTHRRIAEKEQGQ